MFTAKATPHRRGRGVLGLALSLATTTVVLFAASTTPATAAPPGTSAEDRVDQILAADPDATRLSANQVAWPDDGVVLTVGVDAAGSWCGSGYACVHADANRGGYGYAFYDCRTYRLPEYGFPTYQRGGASSWYNNQTDGAKVKFEDEWFSLTPVVAGYGFGNMPSYLNDRAYWLYLLC
ncbi:hypothetical protein [Micromonospora echinofusca]|uniref:Peptidase inhibitor family I36 n=1 Tax=Micromonospora echinofusca TaxID=47858 RepID=A0ABS3VV63_MICEH|nr:hypothetical protein [Micromonospora echinofusca]MBO4208419.1 hypothetical protein [Micromonospora echinofusca]